MAIRILMIASAAFAVAQIWSFQVMAQSTPAPRYCKDVTSTAPAAATPHTVTQEDYPLVSVSHQIERFPKVGFGRRRNGAKAMGL